MVDAAKFVTVKLNVEGTIKEVKVEKGLKFHWDSCDNHNVRVRDDGKVLKQDYYSAAYTTDAIKMSKDDFNIFCNIADNKKEAGDTIVLSKSDIKEAYNLYTQSKLTADISKGIKDLHVDGVISKETDIDISASNSRDEAVARAANLPEQEQKHTRFTVSTKLDNDDKNTDKWLEKTLDGKYEIESGEGEWYITYTNKQGIIVTEDEDGNVWQKEYTKDGITYHEYYEPYYGEYDEPQRMDKKGYFKKYTLNGKTITEHFSTNEDNEMCRDGIEVKWTENGKNFEEHRESNGDFVWREAKYKKDGKEYIEEYDSKGMLIKRWYNKDDKGVYIDACIENYKDGKLATKEKYENRRHIIDFYENGIFVRKKISDIITGVTIVKAAGKGGLLEFEGLKIKETLNQQLSDGAKDYRKEFENKSAAEIAKTIHSQIYGPSKNSKTLAMIDAISSSKMAAVMREYKKLTGWFGSAGESMFKQLSDEYFVDYKKDVWPRIQVAFASYINSKQNYTVIDKIIATQFKNMSMALGDGLDHDKEQWKDFIEKVECCILSNGEHM